MKHPTAQVMALAVLYSGYIYPRVPSSRLGSLIVSLNPIVLNKTRQTRARPVSYMCN